MSWGKAESWDKEQIEAWKHDQWLLMQEIGEDYYKLLRRYDQDSEGGDPFETEERVKWQEEEERAKAEYFKVIAEEEERGYYRQTVSEMIEERSSAKKKREMETKKRENGEDADRSKKDQRDTDKKADMSTRLFRKVELVRNWIRENRFLRVFDGGS